MFCDKCGNEVTGGTKFCPFCGNFFEDAEDTSGKTKGIEIQSQDALKAGVEEQKSGKADKKASKKADKKTDKKQDKKAGKGGEKPKKKKKILPLVIFILILIIAAAAGIFILISPGKKIPSQLSKGKYEEAMTTYEDGVADNFIQKLLANMFLKPEAVSAVVTDYETGVRTYEDAYGYLNAVASMEQLKASETAAEEMTHLQGALESQEAFDNAEALFQSGDYAAAIQAFQELDENDANYAEAQAYLEDAIAKYKEQIFAAVGEPTTTDEFKVAMALLNVAAEVLPDDPDVLAKQAEVQAAYISTVKADTMTAVTENNVNRRYSESLALLADALEVCPDDEQLNNLLQTTLGSYEDYVVAQSAALIEAGDYDGAEQLVAKAHRDMPDNEVITELQEKVGNARPIPLTDLTASDSDDFDKEESSVNDSIGNIYYGNVYTIRGDGYVDYYLGGQYSRLTGTIATRAESSDGDIMILLDNTNLAFSATMTKTTVPQKIDIDVTGVQWLRIKLEGSYSTKLIISEFQLFNK